MQDMRNDGFALKQNALGRVLNKDDPNQVKLKVVSILFIKAGFGGRCGEVRTSTGMTLSTRRDHSSTSPKNLPTSLTFSPKSGLAI